jgi:subtilisin family serine protease
MAIQGRVTLKACLAGLMFFVGAQASANSFEAVPGEYIVKLKKDVNAISATALSLELGAYVKSTIPSGNLVVVKRPTFEMQSSAIKTLNQNEMVEYSEPNYIYRTSRLPNDPDLLKLWGLINKGQNDKLPAAPGVAGVDVDVERAWDITQGSEEVVIAVIDTGISYNHPDLQANMWKNTAELNGVAGQDDDGNGFVDDIYGYDFTTDTGDSDPADDHGHGTHCAGTIGARGDDGAGIVGVNWKVKLMALKFLSAQGGGTLEGAVKSIDYATKMGVDIMSNSWGGGGPSDALKEAIERAHAAGIVFLAAAGNNSSNNDANPYYPASYQIPNLIAVAAIDNKGSLASFSNYGRRSVHVGAPGVNVYSSVLNNGYAHYSGTSMATPHVAGVAGLLLANEPNLTNIEVKERLMRSSRPLSSLKDKSHGGLVSAYNALTNAVAPPDPNDPSNWAFQSISVSSDHPYARSTSKTFEVNVPGAREISLYFSRLETERTYDKVTLFDAAGTKVAELHGLLDDSYSPIVTGSYVKIVFTSDDSVEKYGFDITKAAYR